MSCVEELLSLLLRPVKVFMATSSEAAIESILRRRYECEIMRGDNVAGADLLILDAADSKAEQLVREATKLSIPALVLWQDADVLARLARIGSVGTLARDINAEDFEHLFRVFKIHARECKVTPRPVPQLAAQLA